jgi:hypothetical protein
VVCNAHASEWRLLVSCARRNARSTDLEQIRVLCEGAIDWVRLSWLLNRHRILPIVWNALTAADVSVPDGVRQPMHEAVRQNGLRALVQFAELVRVTTSLERAGIAVLCLKGPTLAQEAYGSLTLRHAGDIDLLLANPRDVLGAQQVLEEAGYVRTVPGFHLNDNLLATYMRMRKDFTYVHPVSCVRIELHWRWSQNAHILPIAVERAWERRRTLEVEGHRLSILHRDDMLLYLAAHGAHTAWFRLKWLCDVSFLLDTYAAHVDLDDLWERSRQLGVSRVVAQTLLLTHSVLDAPLPAVLARQLQRETWVNNIVRMAEQALAGPETSWTADNPAASKLAQLLYRLMLRGDVRYKLHNVYVYSLWTDEWRALSLPRQLFVLHILLRPCLALRERLRREIRV